MSTPNREVRDMTEVSDRSVTLESGRTQQDERHNRQRGNGSRHDPSAHDIADPREQSGSFNHRPNNDRSPATLIRTPVIVGRLIPASRSVSCGPGFLSDAGISRPTITGVR